MTKEKLKNYRNNKLELEDLEIEIQKRKVTDSVQGTSKYSPHIMQNHKIEGTAPENYSLLEHKLELKAQIREIEDFVKSIKDYKTRKAVEMYYIDPVDESGEKIKWEKIADYFNDGSTGESWRKKTDRYFEKNM